MKIRTKNIIRLIYVIVSILLPPIIAVVAGIKYGYGAAIIVSCIMLTFPLITIFTLFKNKAQSGCYIFEKEPECIAYKTDNGYECSACGGRFSFKRTSCPDCGKPFKNMAENTKSV